MLECANSDAVTSLVTDRTDGVGDGDQSQGDNVLYSVADVYIYSQPPILQSCHAIPYTTIITTIISITSID